MQRFVQSLLTVGALCFSTITFAQTNQPQGANPAPGANAGPAGQGGGGRQGMGRGGRAAAPSPTKNLPFDPHDLSGYWNGGGIRFSLGTPAPPMTAWAQARYDKSIPGIGAGGNNPANPRARPLGNDPIMLCDPISYPRIILTAGNYGMQIVQQPKEMIWLFDWFYTRRSIWTDGRKLPEDPDPRFYGYSVGHWDGDTFVVESNGFDDRSWIDDDAHPHSDEMKLTERYHRTDHDTIEFTMTITDPKAYTQPWTSAPMYLRWFPEDQLKARNSGWDDLREDICIPSEEAKYKDLVREPAGTPTNKK
jgi:hypothetical protein